MKTFSMVLVFILAIIGFSLEAHAQADCSSGVCITSGARAYAARMNSTRVFRHDASFQGAEVIYQSSGVATPEAAKTWWMNSPPHRRLLLSGAIQDIQCVGSVCVGRSISAVGNTSQAIVATATNSVSRIKPVSRIRNLLKCR